MILTQTKIPKLLQIIHLDFADKLKKYVSLAQDPWVIVFQSLWLKVGVLRGFGREFSQGSGWSLVPLSHYYSQDGGSNVPSIISNSKHF